MTVDELKSQGNAAAKEGNFEKAIQCYTDAIALDPSNHILYSNRSNIYSQKKDFQHALEDGEKCIELKPDFGKGYVRKADALSGMNKLSEAIAAISGGLDKDPDEPLLKQRHAYLTYYMQNYMNIYIFGSSEEELRMKLNSNPKTAQMVAQDPTLFARVNAARQSPNFFYFLGQDYQVSYVVMELMGLGDLQAQMYTEAPAYAARQPEPYEAAKPKEEVRELTEEEKQGVALKNEGNELFKQGKYYEAIYKYEQAFEVHKNITYLNNISTALLKQEKYYEALEKAEEAYKYAQEKYGSASYQEKAKALTKAGSALHKMKRYEEAIAKLKDSMLEYKDKQTLALLNVVEDEYDDYKLRQSFNPEKAMECKNYGNDLVRSNKFIEAADKFTEGIRMLPDKYETNESRLLKVYLHNNRSLALFKAGYIHASYEDCQQVIAIEPANLKALLRKAQIERMRKQYYLSIETYQKILKIDQSNREAIEGYYKTAIKVNEMQSGKMTYQEIDEIVNIAMSDPEMQKIAKDPGMAYVIQYIQQNPQAAQYYLMDPNVQSRLEKLINAGVIRIGGAHM